MKETISKLRQEIQSLQIVVDKTEQSKDIYEKDLSKAIETQRIQATKIESLLLEKSELQQLVEMKSNFILGIQQRNTLAASSGARVKKTEKQTLMYLEAIQKLSMYIVRKQKSLDPSTNLDNSGHLNTSVIDQETISNIRSLMDEHVFELLDKTELKVM